MTRIDFYVLKQQSFGNRYSLACRIIEKAWKQGHRLVVFTNSEEESRHMDRLLWVARDDSFIPHTIYSGIQDREECIFISHDAVIGEETNENDVLINLADTQPDFFSRFGRLAECIDNDERIKSVGRQKYRYYQERGYPLASHDILLQA